MIDEFKEAKAVNLKVWLDTVKVKSSKDNLAFCVFADLANELKMGSFILNPNTEDPNHFCLWSEKVNSSLFPV